MTYAVVLYRYDLSGGMARSLAPMLLGRPLEAIWHTSVVVYGCEYYYDGGVGIVCEAAPGRTRFGAPLRTEALGSTHVTRDAFTTWTRQCARNGFGAYDYHLLRRNCNHFTQAAVRFLLQRDVPADVRDMLPTLLDTPLGRMLRPTLEQLTGAGSGSSSDSNNSTRGDDAGKDTTTATVSTSTSSCAGLLSQRSGLSEDEEADLCTAQAMLESNPHVACAQSAADYASTRSALELLHSIIDKALTHPREAKYRAVSTSSARYTTTLAPFTDYGATEVLRVAGFVLRPRPRDGDDKGNGDKKASAAVAGADEGEQQQQQQQWYLSDACGSAAVLTQVRQALQDCIDRVTRAAAAHDKGSKQQ